jgi:hypothetical protein
MAWVILSKEYEILDVNDEAPTEAYLETLSTMTKDTTVLNLVGYSHERLLYPEIARLRLTQEAVNRTEKVGIRDELSEEQKTCIDAAFEIISKVYTFYHWEFYRQEKPVESILLKIDMWIDDCYNKFTSELLDTETLGVLFESVHATAHILVEEMRQMQLKNDEPEDAIWEEVADDPSEFKLDVASDETDQPLKDCIVEVIDNQVDDLLKDSKYEEAVAAVKQDDDFNVWLEVASAPLTQSDDLLGR